MGTCGTSSKESGRPGWATTAIRGWRDATAALGLKPGAALSSSQGLPEGCPLVPVFLLEGVFGCPGAQVTTRGQSGPG